MALIKISSSKSEEEFQSSLDVLNHLSRFSSVTAEVCELLWKLMLVKADAENVMMYKNPCIWVSIGDSLLQVAEGMNGTHDEAPENGTIHPNAFANKSLSSRLVV